MFANMLALKVVLGLFFVSFALAGVSDNKQNKQAFLSNKETSSTAFITLVLMRVIFGLASVMGFRESLSNIMGGIFVPPGADDYDDYGGDDLLPEFFR